ncbi:PAS domain s-box [Halodesulfurarchaeum formicicum]|uniref:histidine kinase n=1 Tax=Halodesulfurarchaeum formicicum TaxID=1873524 RepID=A0A1D8S2K3_9EURY|nr:PAS domain-containing sensor histidine kinase [Halodesulfurarchaeum formicicum]AOW79592.1 PAS domain s-box [Halodesulfurarchaeum formicicum]APE94843.1 PAS domain s-box [Halodesulfurarchaeum formicicum]
MDMEGHTEDRSRSTAGEAGAIGTFSAPAHRRYVGLTTGFGLLVLVGLSVVQKWLIGAPTGNLVGYVVPALFGGGTGFVYGYFNVGRKRRIRELERETEIRRLISAVNHALVETDDVAAMGPEIAGIVGSSSLFECTYVHLFAPPEFETVCVRNADETAATIRAFHTETYIEQVFESGAYRIEDVTASPFDHHETDERSHAGVGIAIGHEAQRYGVLTVHFPPSVTPTPAEIDLLETIGDDFGYFVHTQILEAERQSFAEIVERIDDPVMVQDRDGTFQVLNEAVTAVAGKSRSALLGADETPFMDEATAETIAAMKDRVLETEAPVSYQVTPNFPDGQERTFSTTRYPYYDERGHLDGTVAICRDVTDLQAHQRQLRVLDRVLRHNVNNNMNVVQGYAEMIREEASGVSASYAAKIASNSQRLLDIAHKQRKITDFLSETQPRERIELEALLDQIVGRIESEFPHASVSLTCPGAVHVWASRSVGDAIEELLTNSVVHAERAEPNPRVTVQTEARRVRVRIVDENPAIPEMDQDVISGADELGALRHGSGLGLWLVKLIVDHSGGAIAHRERDPQGNVVIVELPASSQADTGPN